MENVTSRAVILPTMADPFLLNFWIRQYHRIWKDEIDALYIGVYSPIIENKEVRAFLEKLLEDPKIHLDWHNQHLQHGDSINRILDLVNEKYVMLIEDDCFVFRRGVIGNNFALLENESYDMIGSKRGSCGHEILDRADELWGIKASGYGDNGCNFWPNCFFTKKQTLIDTDRNFNAVEWKTGENIPALGDFVAPQTLAGDTFVNTSLQLHAKGLRALYVPQFHGNVTDIEDYTEQRALFNGETYWLHVGSLSSGMDGVLMDEEGRVLTKHFIDPPKGTAVLPPHCNTDMEKVEWERRLQWFSTFYEKALELNLDGDMRDLLNLYGKAVDQVIVGYCLNRKHISVRQRIFDMLMRPLFL